jgi:hypothetical protein
MASLVYSAGNAFPFMLLYAADHSLFAASTRAGWAIAFSCGWGGPSSNNLGSRDLTEKRC